LRELFRREVCHGDGVGQTPRRHVAEHRQQQDNEQSRGTVLPGAEEEQEGTSEIQHHQHLLTGEVPVGNHA
jgi:hypothetical protein